MIRRTYQSNQVLSEKQQIRDLTTALRGITVDPRKSLGVFDQVGSLEVGEEADFVVLDRDPCHPKHFQKLNTLKIQETWIGGRRVFTCREG